MKKTKFITTLLLAMVLGVPVAVSQDADMQRPAYIVVTTLHWNMDMDDFDMDTWLSVEKEYFDKITAKNDKIMGSGYYTHRYSPDNRELLYVRTYANWADIDEADKRNSELAKEAWPEQEKRQEFFQKRGAYYGNFHSDEIYAPMDNAILHDRKSTEILMVRRSQFSYPEDGSREEFNAMHKEGVDKVFRNNEKIKGYYPNAHVWGSAGNEFVEAFFVNSMADLDAMFDRNGELAKEHWPDEAERKKATALREKYFTGVHGDYIYTVVKDLIK